MRKHTIFVVTDSGCEEACAIEITRWVKHPTVIHRNVVTLEGTLDDAVLLGYYLQTARRVCVQLIDPAEGVEGQKADEELLKEVLTPTATFKVEAEILALDSEGTGEAGQLVQELIEVVADWAIDELNRTVKLSHPDIVIYACQTTEHLYIGIDVVGRSLAKRDWRIMLSRRSLKSTIAAATIIYAGATEKEVILDPIADDGTLSIEAALLLTRTSPRSYDRKFSYEQWPVFAGRDWKAWKTTHKKKEINKIIAYGANLHEMKAVRTNAKLAGVDKEILATKVSVDWVDAKNDERSIDRIITSPIPSGKSITPKQVEKINEQLFYQAEYVIKKNKTVTTITEKPDELVPHAEKYGFKIERKIPVLMGLRKMVITIFKRS
jgi:23S rRNA G2445 N2-methylase RlmL